MPELPCIHPTLSSRILLKIKLLKTTLRWNPAIFRNYTYSMKYLTTQTEDVIPLDKATPDSRAAKGWILYAVAFLTAIIALLPRLDGFDYFWGKYLWAEDGNIFLHQSEEYGALAIIKPYAGYLLIYPRIVTEISKIFDLLYQPTFLLVGWILAYLVLVHSIVESVKSRGESILTLIVLITLCSLQPNYGEVFFNITNSQWMLGAALCIYLLTDIIYESKKQTINSGLLLLLALTGPFSIILTPVLIVKISFRNDWSTKKFQYLPVFFGALIQFIVFLTNGRPSYGEMNTNFSDWFFAFFNILFFGVDDNLDFLAALLIWSMIFYLLLERYQKNKITDSSLQISMLILFLAFLIILAGLLSHKHNPGAIVALGGGNRYSWIPYILVLVSAFILSSERKIIAGLMVFLFSFICFANFHKVSSPNLQFASFVKKSKVEQTYIPIHPQEPMFPGWHIFAKNESTSKLLDPINIEIKSEDIIGHGLTYQSRNGKLEIKSISNDPILIFKDKLTCPEHLHAALNINLTRETAGWMEIFWSSDGNFNKFSSLRRWYPSGKVRSEFAFPISANGVKLRFDPLEIEGTATIEKIELLCL